MLSDKKLNPIVTELFIRDTKLNIFLVFITESYFAVPSTYYVIMKIPNKQELENNVSNNLSDIDFKDFMYLCKKCTAKTYHFLVIDATLASDNPLSFRKNLLERI